MVELKNINISYDKPLIEDGEIRVLDGKIIAIIGESGSGKSTLLYHIGLISSNDSYEYRFDGELLNLSNDKEMSLIRKKKIGYIFQENNLVENLTIKENFKLFTRLSGNIISNNEVDKYLSFVKLDISSDYYPKKLSSGERQRVAIACVLSKQPNMIIADEPTSALDSKNSTLIMDIFKKIAYERHKKIVIATHNGNIYNQADVVYEIKNQKIILRNG